ncbi:hypothetical protein GCM10010425_84050 [Streptomyces spororaveus]|uniref:Uncharacterized protein n=1 Tax=Streptomyces spororaveus TaxID=284039 RepID=A0ABQ3T2W2_9ACTN|nr:hypothetical protein Sspor_02920 [Streptomyces spororaveus]
MTEPIDAVPTAYSGTRFRSRLEADWAATRKRGAADAELQRQTWKVGGPSPQARGRPTQRIRGHL